MANEFIIKNGFQSKGNSQITGSLSVTGGITGSYTGSFTGDGSGLTGISAAYGVFGISDASGSYTYYTDLSSSLSAAVSGDVIEAFADYTETTSFQLNFKSGVNINLNGYTYEYAAADTNHTLIDPIIGGAVVTIFNGIIKRTNSSAPTDTLGTCIRIQNSSTNITLQGVTVIAEDGSNAAYIGTGTLQGGFFRQIGTTAGANNGFQSVTNSVVSNVNVHCDDKRSLATGLVFNSHFRSDGNYGLFVGSGGRARNCTAYSTAAAGLYVVGEAFNCVGDSTAADGIFGATAGKLYNCTGKSTAGIGIYHGNECYNSVGFSTSTYGMQILGNTQTVRTVNSTAFSSAAAAINNRAQIYNCSAITEWNDANGHAIISSWPGSNVHDCYVEVANSAAYGVHAPISNIYVTNIKGKGMTTMLNINSNLQANTPDAYGNIIIG